MDAVPARGVRARRRLGLLGPAFVAAIAYVDPGNVATNTSAGAGYGYRLLWVVVLANVAAGLVQYLAAKIGLVTGRSLPEVIAGRLGRWPRRLYWAQAELVAVATDIAEVLGGAVALSLLFGLPLVLGGLVTGVVSTAILLVGDRRGQRGLEHVVTALLGVLAAGFVAGLVVAPPDPGPLLAGLVPGFAGTDSLVLAAGILGATVMPHAIYLHSALARDRHGRPAPGAARRRLLAATRVDVGVALLIAGAVNAALMLLGASALRGQSDRASSLDGVYRALDDTLGHPLALAFAVALLVSGLASTAVGGYAGSIVMSGLLRVRVPLLARRVLTLVPALLLLGAGVEPTRALVLSQVVLSFGIPFALLPLVVLTARPAVMGPDANARATTVTAAVVAAAVVALNVALIADTVGGS